MAGGQNDDESGSEDDHETALMAASRGGELDRVLALLEAGADVAQARAYGIAALMDASEGGHLECVRALLEAGADVALESRIGWTALMLASRWGHVECVRVLLEAGANVAQENRSGSTALMAASRADELECVRALLEAGADVMQVSNDGTCALKIARRSLETLQLFCAYAPSRDAVRAQLESVEASPECAEWLDVTRRWTSPLHHFEFLPLERVRALLAEGADAHAGDGTPDAPTPLELATARLARVDGRDDVRAALIVALAAPWSPKTHGLFPAAAKARAVELLRIGWLLARHHQRLSAGTAQVEVALRDAWLAHVMPHAIVPSSS